MKYIVDAMYFYIYEELFNFLLKLKVFLQG
jgi:hypothetical protein